ncbi:hypothetical protein U1Q18_020358 [Sarracenia purpurea var. burkii]
MAYLAQVWGLPLDYYSKEVGSNSKLGLSLGEVLQMPLKRGAKINCDSESEFDG